MKKLFTEGHMHGRTHARTHNGQRTKCDHKSSPCHYVTGELKKNIEDIYSFAVNTIDIVIK